MYDDAVQKKKIEIVIFVLKTLKEMKKAIYILMLLMASASLQLIAQQNFVSISFGASIPQGDYAATGDLSSNGYANTGGAIKFDGGYFPVSYFGIGGSFSFGSNYATRDSLLSDVITYIEENSSGIGDIPEDAEALYGSGFWNYINLFLGPHFSIRATQNLYFDFRGLAGLSIIRAPNQELTITYDGNSIYTNSSYNNVAFGWTAGGGIRYKFNENLALKLSVDYIQTKAKNTYTFNLFSGVVDDVPPLDAEFNIKALEITAGLAYSF
jgi:opacity protein-like surface antigen